jgi:hypothetical protein
VVEPNSTKGAQKKLPPGQHVRRCHWPNGSSVHNEERYLIQNLATAILGLPDYLVANRIKPMKRKPTPEWRIGAGRIEFAI